MANRVILFKDHKLFAADTPAGICARLSGKVYETDDIAAVKAPHLALTERQDCGKTVTRFVCYGDCEGFARRAVPNIEDAFLCIYRDEAL